MMRKILFLMLCVSLGAQFSWAQSERALEYRLKGVKLLQDGDLENATQYLKKAAQLEPTYAAPYNDLGITYERMGKDKKAEQAYRDALQADPYYAPAHSNMARFFEKKRRFDVALQAWQARAKLGPPSDPGRQEAMQRVAHLKRQIPDVPNMNPAAFSAITPPELEDQKARELAQMFIQDQHR